MSDPRHIFVYGSLLSRIAHPQGERLRREARLVGEARLAGRLYRVSWYPGFVPAGGATEFVHGEVYEFANAATLDWLDEYEGITRGATSVTEPEEYARRVMTVALDAGGTIECWVYVYLRDTGGLVPVQGGVWHG
ncbi:MAG: gamma-glutamylcyclotransferase [Hyphomicrobiales bacterium]|nr:gamma-glutamylcyclotransferase [Hyphomicrobiales bacterium]